MANGSSIIVFLGPSLPLTMAQAILPQADFRAPAQCGDIFKAVLERPQTIVLIDGFFEHTAAVWHKEILYALEQGVAVYGASSMGALRAAELQSFGMIGVGDIFYDYLDGQLQDDAEVALLHTAAEDGYQAMTLPLVNIRKTIDSY